MTGRPRVILNEVIVTNLQIQEEGLNVGNNRTSVLNFTGGVDVSVNDGVVNVDVTGGVGGGGTVTSFSAGDLSPLFTTSEATPTTTPALSFTISQYNGRKFIASPADGSLGNLVSRAIVAADIPDLSGTYYLASNPAGYGTGTVTSVSGTLNRVTSTGGATPVIDISASYVGQSSITTTGTLTSGATGAGFTIALGTSTVTGDLAFSNLTQGSARSVLGVTGNAGADFASIQGATDQVLRVDNAGTGLSFGSIDLSKAATVGTSILPVANGGTSFASYTIGDLVQASAAGVLAKLNSVATGNVLISGGVATVSSWGKVTSSHIDATVQTAGLSWLLASGGTATGTNTFAMGSNPFIMTSTNVAGTGATASHQLVLNSLTTGNGFDAASSSITTGYLEKLTSTSTVVNHTLGTNAHLGVVSTGANGTASKTVVGANFIVQNTGTTNTNVGAYFEATGASTYNAAIQAVGNIQTKGYETTATYNLSISKYNENTTQSIAMIGNNLYITSALAFTRENTSVSRGNGWVFYTGYSGLNTNDIGYTVFNTGSSTVQHPFNINQSGVITLIAGGKFGWVTSTTDSRGGVASNFSHSAGTIQVVPTVGMFVGSASTATAILHVKAGTATASTAPIKIDSSGTGVTGLNTTAEKGAIEFTDRGLWFSPAASTRHKVLHGLVGAAAPATTAIGVIADYYGTSGTRVLTTPNTWISIVGDDGNTYKIPAYS